MRVHTEVSDEDNESEDEEGVELPALPLRNKPALGPSSPLEGKKIEQNSGTYPQSPPSRRRPSMMDSRRRASMSLRRVQSQSAKLGGEDDSDYDDRDWLEFMIEPSFDWHSRLFHGFLSILVLSDAALLFLMTIDGPQFYDSGHHKATYSAMGSSMSYFIARLALNVPIFIHCVPLLVFNVATLQDYFSPLDWAKILGVSAWMVHTAQFYLWHLGTSERDDWSEILHLLEFGKLAYIFHVLYLMPEVQAIGLTFHNSREALKVSVIIVVIFNLVFATAIYYLEPCYDVTNCQWKDMFDAAFFGFVTMATVGYGNQVPQLMLTRIVVIVLMCLGGLFLAMPLAIVLKYYNAAFKVCETKFKEDHGIVSMTSMDGSGSPSGKLKTNTKDAEHALRVLNLFNKHDHILEMIAQFYAEVEVAKQKKYTSTEQADKGPSLDLIKAYTDAEITHKLEFTGSNDEESESPLDFIHGKGMSLEKRTHLTEKVQASKARMTDKYNRRRSGSIETLTSASELLDADHILAPSSMKEAEKARNRETVDPLHLAVSYHRPRVLEEIHDMTLHLNKLALLGPLNARFRSKVRKAVAKHRAGARARRRGQVGMSAGGSPDRTRKTANMAAWGATVKASAEDSLRYQLFLIFSLPLYNETSQRVSWFLAVSGFLATLLVFLESMDIFHITGESSKYCEGVVELYCANKDKESLDPGCFVNDSSGDKLRYFCGENDCYGIGSNFGGSASDAYTCPRNYDGADDEYTQPFRASNELRQTTVYTMGLDSVHQLHAVCERPECVDTGNFAIDGNSIWIPIETFFFVIFSMEVLIRLYIARGQPATFSFFKFYRPDLHPNNMVDLLSILPYIVIMIYSTATGVIDFNVRAASPTPRIIKFFVFLKIIPLLKLGRSLRSARILADTMKNGWKRTVVNLGILLISCIPFGYIMYVLERGDPCYVGSGSVETDECVVGAGGVGGAENNFDYKLNEDALVMINDDEDKLSLVPNALYGYWFTVVTTTTTGYGDVTASTWWGMFVTTFIVVCGSLFLSVPIAVMCDTFMESYQHVVSNEIEIKNEMRNLLDQNEGLGSRSGGVRRLSTKVGAGGRNRGAGGVTGRFTGSSRKSGAMLTAFDRLKGVVGETKRKYWSAREELHKGMTEAYGDPELMLATIQKLLESVCKIHSNIENVSKFLNKI